MIPIIEVEIPEYQIKKHVELSGEYHETESGTKIPIEYWRSRPNFQKVSDSIIKVIRKNFNQRHIGFRMLSSGAHPGKTQTDIIEKIIEIGHDRYDPIRKGDRYANVENKKIDIFALNIEVGRYDGERGEMQIKYGLESFYNYPFKVRELPEKIDIGIVYDMSQMVSVSHYYEESKREKKDGYVFKNSENKASSVLGIIKIQ